MTEASIFKKLTHHARNSLKESENIARSCRSDHVEPEHLLMAVYLERGCLGSSLLQNLGIGEEAFDCIFKKSRTKTKSFDDTVSLSPKIKSILIRAYHLASDFQYSYVGTEHLVYALLENNNETMTTILRKISKKKQPLTPEANPDPKPLPNLSKLFELQGISSGNAQQDTPLMDEFCSNINDRVRDGQETIFVGRKQEIDRLINILGRKQKNNALLVGDPGVGKTALVTGLAQRIESGEVPRFLLSKKIYELDLALVVAGTSFRGEFEARLKDIVREASEDPDIILFIDEIHTMIGAGNANGGLDAANILKPALARGEIHCIGATTQAEYKKFIEKDAALDRRFQIINLPEPSRDEALSILQGIRPSFEEYHNLTITDQALEYAVDLSIRYLTDRFLPDKAIDLIDESASEKRNKKGIAPYGKRIRALEHKQENVIWEKNDLLNKEHYEQAALLRKRESQLNSEIEKLEKQQEKMEQKCPVTIDGSDIIDTVSRLANIPIEKITSGKFSQIRTLKSHLEKQVIGQKHAISVISNTLSRSYAGLGNAKRPTGSFLLLGPTGVGKTLTAKVLAQKLFDDSQALIRIDMSEFRQQHSVASLLGAPAGYVGYGEGGKFTEQIRRKPYSVVLFDEIEKAHPDILNVLLQILEEGELTDAEGRKVNFRNTIVLLTSNIGSQDVGIDQPSVGFNGSSLTTSKQFDILREKFEKELKLSLRPEILGRLDSIVVYRPLEKSDIKKIVRQELKETQNKLLQQDIHFSYTESVVSFIAEKSLKGFQGARLVRKNVQDYIENYLAQLIIQNKLTSSSITLDTQNGQPFIAPASKATRKAPRKTQRVRA